MAATLERAGIRSFETITRDRGVVTIPAELRHTAGVHTDDPVTWVELSPRMWLVAPAEERPAEVATTLVNVLLAERSPFPKLMSRLVSGAVATRPRQTERVYRRDETPPLTEQQMVALGASLDSSTAPRPQRYHRGRR